MATLIQHKIGRLLQILWLASLLSAVPLSAQDDRPSLRGGLKDGAMQLYWETYHWPKDLTGFVLKKKTKTHDVWQNLSPVTLYPQVDDRDWSTLGLNTQEAKDLQSVYQNYLSQGKLNRTTKEHLIQKLQEHDGLMAGDRINLKNDFNLALILGFAFVDHSFTASQGATYGLFFVHQNQQVSEQPMAVFSPERNKNIQPKINFKVDAGKINLAWTVAEQEYSNAALYGFKVIRKGLKSAKVDTLFASPLGYFKSEQGLMHWNLQDESADPLQNYAYTLTPVTIFQQLLKSSTSLYKASLYKPLQLPGIDSLSIVNEIDVRLYFKTDSLKGDRKRIKHFFVERRLADSLHFNKIASKLTLKTMSLTDTSSLQYQKSYYYRLSAIDQMGNLWTGKASKILYTGIKLPQHPDSLTATFKMINDKPYVLLSWAKSHDQVTEGYLLQSDEGQGNLLDNLSIPLIKNHELLYQISGDGASVYTFKIIPVNKVGVWGMAATVSIKIPPLRLPLFDDFSALLNKSNLIELIWSYPENIEIKGFNILVNGQRIASPQQIQPTQRKYLVPLYFADQAGKLNTFQVEAVSDALTKKSMPNSVYIPAFTVAAPEQLKVTLQTEKGKRYALLHWEHPAPENIREYLIFTDEASEKTFLPLSTATPVKETNYVFKIPDPDRDSYTFQIAAVSSKGNIGPAASITLSLKDFNK